MLNFKKISIFFASVLMICSCSSGNEGSEIPEYVVTWMNYDGTILEVDNVLNGSIASFDGDNPTRETDESFYYTFSGWDHDVGPVTRNEIYVAQFESHVNDFTITWVVDKKSTTEHYKLNDTPSFKGDTSKKSDAQYTYSFAGWQPSIKPVDSNATYTATYSTSLNKYTVTWKNWDGQVIEIDRDVPYGSTPSFNSNNPTRQDNQNYYYSFTGWDKPITQVVGDVTYIAQFESHVNDFIVTWIVDGKTTTEHYKLNDTPSFKGDLSKEADAQYTYTFSKWVPLIQKVSKDITYVAQYSTTLNQYTVTWKNWDGTVLAVNTNVPYGTIPTCSVTPTKTSTEQYYYAFTGWTPSIKVVTGNVEYTACFNEKTRQYQVTFDAGDGYFDNLVGKHSKSIYVNYGEKPVFNEVPLCSSEKYASVSFTSWDREFEVVKGNQTYSAQYVFSNRVLYSIDFEANANDRTVTFSGNGAEEDGRFFSRSFKVDWGDGSSVVENSWTHTYSPTCTGVLHIKIIDIENPYIKTDKQGGICFTNKNYSYSRPLSTGNNYIKKISAYIPASFSYEYVSVSQTHRSGPFSSYACYGLSGLTELSIDYEGQGYCLIPTEAFSNCYNLKKITTNNVTIFGNNAFKNCKLLDTLSIDSSNYLTNTQNYITLNESCFYGCNAITNVKLSSAVKIVNNLAFALCNGLKSVELLGTTTIGSSAFFMCGMLSTVRLPACLNQIGESAFSSCESLSTCYFAGTKETFAQIQIGNNAFYNTKISSIICSNGTIPLATNS